MVLLVIICHLVLLLYNKSSVLQVEVIKLTEEVLRLEQMVRYIFSSLTTQPSMISLHCGYSFLEIRSVRWILSSLRPTKSSGL